MASTPMRVPVKSYTLELRSLERDGRPIYRLRMRWNRDCTWRRYRKTWKYKLIQNAMNKLVVLTVQFGQPAEVTVFGYSADITGLGPPSEAARRSPDEKS